MRALEIRTPEGHEFVALPVSRADAAHESLAVQSRSYAGRARKSYRSASATARSWDYQAPILEWDQARFLEVILTQAGQYTVRGDIFDRETTVNVEGVRVGRSSSMPLHATVRFRVVEVEPHVDARALVLLDAGLGLGWRDVEFARDSAAFAVDANGVYQSFAVNALRLPHFLTANDGKRYATTLLEPGATNLLTRSEAFDHGDWSKTDATVTADDRTAPDGEATADRLAANTDGANARAEQQVSGLSDDAIVTASVHAAPGDVDFVRVLVRGKDNSVVGRWFDLASGTIGSATGSPVDATIEGPLAGGYYRCSVTADVGSGGTTPDMSVRVANADGQALTDDGEHVFIWGAQVEVSPVATSYTQTVSTTEDREPDNLYALVDPNVVGTRMVYVDWIEQGTAFLGGSERYCQIGKGDDSNPRFIFRSTATDGVLRSTLVNAAGDASGFSTSGIVSLGDRVRAVPGWEINDAGTQIRSTLSTRVGDGDWTTHTPGDWIALDFGKWSLEDGEDKARLWINSRGTGNVGRVGLRTAALFDRTLSPEQAESKVGGPLV